MDRARMDRLGRDASGMGTSNHIRFLSEAMQALRDPAAVGDREADELEAPIRALRLLEVMWGSSYADRPDPKAALNDVGLWLERWLLGEPAISVEDLLVDLGWMKRLAKHHEAVKQEAGFSKSRPGPQKNPVLSFGKRIREIERRRAEAIERKRRLDEGVGGSAPGSVKGAAPVAGAEKQPESVVVTLPEELAVVFAEFNEAREVRKRVEKRAAAKKEPKESILVLKAVDKALQGFRFECSTTRTAGMAEVFELVRTTSGAPDWVAYAGALERKSEGVVLVGRLALRPTASRGRS